MHTIHKARELLEKLNSLSVVDKTKEYELIHTLMACYGDQPDTNTLELVLLLERILLQHEALQQRNQELEEYNVRLKDIVTEHNAPKISPRNYVNQMQRHQQDHMILSQVPRDVPASPYASPFPSPRDMSTSTSPFSSPISSPREPFSPRTSPFASPRLERSNSEDNSILRRSGSQTGHGLSSSKILSVSRPSLPIDISRTRIPTNLPSNSPRRPPQHDMSHTPTTRIPSSRIVNDPFNEIMSTRNRGVSEPVAYVPSHTNHSPPSPNAYMHKISPPNENNIYVSSHQWDPNYHL
jgi:hypothetical protein